MYSFLLFVFTVSNVAAVLFSPYKDVTINLDWNTNVISTNVTGNESGVTTVMPTSGASTLTWAFANGYCGSENWGGLSGSSIASANVQLFVSAGLKYIISSGGAAGSFKCSSDADFETFIQRYSSTSLLGFDFDIEGGMSQDEVNSLVQRITNAKSKYPSLRFSFTVATYGGDANPSLGSDGTMVINAIKSTGLSDYFINLMVMDYGAATSDNCVVVNGQCQMGQSAVKAAQNLHEQYSIPYSQIELTPMIGGNDTPNETFTLEDTDTVTAFALSNGLAGVHHWSFDRDTDCNDSVASATCNSYGQAGTLGFTQRFSGNL